MEGYLILEVNLEFPLGIVARACISNRFRAKISTKNHTDAIPTGEDSRSEVKVINPVQRRNELLLAVKQ